MKVILKTLNNKIFNIILESNEISVLSLKEEASKLSTIDSSNMRLIHKGVILADDKNLKEYRVEDNSIIICASIAHEEKDKTRKKDTKDSKDVKEKAEILEESKEKESHERDRDRPSLVIKDPNRYLAEIEELREMGFSQTAITEAINATKGNKDLAIAVLTGEIPLDELNIRKDSNDIADSNVEADTQKEVFSLLEEIGVKEIKLDYIASIAKVFCEGDSSKLPELFDAFKSIFPKASEIVEGQNDQFMELFLQPVSQEDNRLYNIFISKCGKSLRNVPKASAYIKGITGLSEKEKGDIDNLILLGFTEKDATEAYLICNRNEEAAANYLFDKKY